MEVMNQLVPLAEGARFENTEALETIGPDLVLSFRPQSLTEESEVGDEPVKRVRTDSSATVWPHSAGRLHRLQRTIEGRLLVQLPVPLVDQVVECYIF
jgi:hypothetical protein